MVHFGCVKEQDSKVRVVGELVGVGLNHEMPGPNKPEWQAFVGKYLEADGNTTTVTIRNGYLYIGWDGEMKLTEYQPGLFFAADGEVVRFQDDKLYLRGIRPFLKEKPGKP